MAEWIESYLLYVRAAGHYQALESYLQHRDIWQTVPDMVAYMVNRK